MVIEKLESGVYEAITNVRDGGIIIKDGFIPIQFVGYGDTHFEAIQNCLGKVEQFINPLKNGGSSNPTGNIPEGYDNEGNPR